MAQPVEFADPFNAYSGTSGGASDAAERISWMRYRIVQGFTASAIGSERLTEPLRVVAEIFQRCRLANWDHEGAEPISSEALTEAQALLLSIPSYMPLPEIFPEATGAIAFEWYRKPGYRYVITVSGKGTLEYAGLFGSGNDTSGESRLDGGFPKMIREHLRWLFPGDQIHAV
ncbi:MAG: hypothetical protein HY525_13405 [Betaproteobacteria bacterium]|nr:hypothetical protein [Betaproteobacteria bacterium]